MSYTHIFISSIEAQYYNKEGVTAADLGQTPQQFAAAFEIVHAGIESIIIQELNRSALTAAILAGTDYAHMKNVCKLIAAMMIGNWFVWLKHLKMNKVVIADQMTAMIAEVPICTSEMRKMLLPFRMRSCGAVRRDISYEHIWDESDDDNTPNDEGELVVNTISETIDNPAT